MNKILLLYAHPTPRRSSINRVLKNAVTGLEGITVHDLYAHYPNFLIDIKREQTLCLEHDIIIFQHPFYWYSFPAIMKEWCDLVLEHGWAYGSETRALSGKTLIHAITAGGDEKSYSKKGSNCYTIEELLRPRQATARLCNMQWLPPFAILGVHQGIPSSTIQSHAHCYRTLLLALRDGRVNLKKAAKASYINDNITKIIEDI